MKNRRRFDGIKIYEKFSNINAETYRVTLMYQYYAKYIFDRCGYIETLALYPAEGISFLDSIPMYCY